MPTHTSRAKAPHHHEGQFYSHDTVLLDRLLRFVISVLGAGNVAIVVATQSHRERLAERLKSEGLDVAAAIVEGTYIPVDAVSTLSLFMVNDMSNSTRFVEVMGCLIEQAAKKGKAEHPRDAVFGEWVSLMSSSKNGRPVDDTSISQVSRLKRSVPAMTCQSARGLSLETRV